MASSSLNVDAEFELATYFTSNFNEMKASISQQLAFYGMYKQATQGPCNREMPGMFQYQEKKKWQAWSDCGQMSKDEAKRRYVENLTEAYPRWRQWGGLKGCPAFAAAASAAGTHEEPARPTSFMSSAVPSAPPYTGDRPPAPEASLPPVGTPDAPPPHTPGIDSVSMSHHEERVGDGDGDYDGDGDESGIDNGDGNSNGDDAEAEADPAVAARSSLEERFQDGAGQPLSPVPAVAGSAVRTVPRLTPSSPAYRTPATPTTGDVSLRGRSVATSLRRSVTDTPASRSSVAHQDRSQGRPPLSAADNRPSAYAAPVSRSVGRSGPHDSPLANGGTQGASHPRWPHTAQTHLLHATVREADDGLRELSDILVQDRERLSRIEQEFGSMIKEGQVASPALDRLRSLERRTGTGRRSSVVRTLVSGPDFFRGQDTPVSGSNGAAGLGPDVADGETTGLVDPLAVSTAANPRQLAATCDRLRRLVQDQQRRLADAENMLSRRLDLLESRPPGSGSGFFGAIFDALERLRRWKWLHTGPGQATSFALVFTLVWFAMRFRSRRRR